MAEKGPGFTTMRGLNPVSNIKVVSSYTTDSSGQQVSSDKYIFNTTIEGEDLVYDSNIKYFFRKGEYLLTNIPVSHPLALYNENVEDTSSSDSMFVDISYVGSPEKMTTYDVNGRLLNFYYGNVQVFVTGDFDKIKVIGFENTEMTTSDVFLYHGGNTYTDIINDVASNTPYIGTEHSNVNLLDMGSFERNILSFGTAWKELVPPKWESSESGKIIIANTANSMFKNNPVFGNLKTKNGSCFVGLVNEIGQLVDTSIRQTFNIDKGESVFALKINFSGTGINSNEFTIPFIKIKVNDTIVYCKSVSHMDSDSNDEWETHVAVFKTIVSDTINVEIFNYINPLVNINGVLQNSCLCIDYISIYYLDPTTYDGEIIEIDNIVSDSEEDPSTDPNNDSNLPKLTDFVSIMHYDDDVTSDIATAMMILGSFIRALPSSHAIVVLTSNILPSNVFGNANWDNKIITLNANNTRNTFSFYLDGVRFSLNTVVLIHEMLHIFGIGIGYQWFTSLIDMESSTYRGVNGIRNYKRLLESRGYNVDNLEFLPLEDNFGAGTQHSHFEEGLNENYQLEGRTINGVDYPILVNELMSGFLDLNNVITSVTVGVLEDLGALVNYDSPYVNDNSPFLKIISSTISPGNVLNKVIVRQIENNTEMMLNDKLGVTAVKLYYKNSFTHSESLNKDMIDKGWTYLVNSSDNSVFVFTSTYEPLQYADWMVVYKMEYANELVYVNNITDQRANVLEESNYTIAHPDIHFNIQYNVPPGSVTDGVSGFGTSFGYIIGNKITAGEVMEIVGRMNSKTAFLEVSPRFIINSDLESLTKEQLNEIARFVADASVYNTNMEYEIIIPDDITTLTFSFDRDPNYLYELDSDTRDYIGPPSFPSAPENTVLNNTIGELSATFSYDVIGYSVDITPSATSAFILGNTLPDVNFTLPGANVIGTFQDGKITEIYSRSNDIGLMFKTTRYGESGSAYFGLLDSVSYIRISNNKALNDNFTPEERTYYRQMGFTSQYGLNAIIIKMVDANSLLTLFGGDSSATTTMTRGVIQMKSTYKNSYLSDGNSLLDSEWSGTFSNLLTDSAQNDSLVFDFYLDSTNTSDIPSLIPLVTNYSWTESTYVKDISAPWIDSSYNNRSPNLPLITLNSEPIVSFNLSTFSPYLPFGMTIDTKSGQISGTPAITSPMREYIISYTGAYGGSGDVTVSFEVINETGPNQAYNSYPVYDTSFGARIADPNYQITSRVTSASSSAGVTLYFPQNDDIYLNTLDQPPVFAYNINSITDSIFDQSTYSGSDRFTLICSQQRNSDGTMQGGPSNIDLSDPNNNTFSISPALPTGVSLNANTGTISGTMFSFPSQLNFTVTIAGSTTYSTPNGSAQITLSTNTTGPSPPTVLFLSGITNNNTISITLATIATTWEYSIDSGSTWTTGIGTSFTLPNGTYAISAVQVRNSDAGGNTSDSRNNNSSITVDTAAPSPPTVSFLSGIANNTTVSIILASGASTWEYSINSGTNWTTGSGTSFTLSDGTYAINAVQVRNSDTAGNTSGSTNNTSSITIDTGAPSPPTVSFISGISNNGTINITLASGATTWEYSTNSGTNWTTGTATSFTLPEGTYAISAVQVRNSDEAGNASGPTANTSYITIDTSAPSPPTVSFPSSITTNNNTISITLATDATTWEYSINSGANWITGTATSFTLSDGLYAVSAVQVRNSDAAGNTSGFTYNTSSIIVDTGAPSPPTVSFPSGITNNNTISIILASGATTWEYSTNSGTNWTTGSATSFTLSDGTYAISAVQVRNIDEAGNTSGSTNNTSSITIDTGAPSPPTVSFPSGTTNNALVIVTLASGATTWEYSVNNGSSWTTGSATLFTLQPGVYAISDVQVRNSDTGGNASARARNRYGFTVLTTDTQVSMITNNYAFAALKEDGTVVAWGSSGYGGSGVPSGLSGVKAIYSNIYAFAALKQDGTVVAWGHSSYGGSGVPSGLSGVKAIYSTYGAFAALKEDGSVEAWGDSIYGGSGVPSGLSGVKAIYSTVAAFAALKEDGSVEAWGQSISGGSGVPSGLSGVKAISSNLYAFAALKEDGTVEAWGASGSGGSGVPSVSGVKTIYSNERAFAALKEDGTVEAWGDSNFGGTGMHGGLSGVNAIYSTHDAFAALKDDGTVSVWGDSGSGANDIFASSLSNVNTIYSTYSAFAALKSDGTVTVWGDSGYGGSGVPVGLGSVNAIYSTNGAFAALKSDGTVAAWGHSNFGGSGMPVGLSGVKTIYSTNHAFAALKTDGTVVAWGNSSKGGDANAVQSQLTSVKNISYGKYHYQGMYYTSTVIDPSPPSPPVINTISTPTNNSTPTITGTGITGHTITLFKGGSTNIGTATVANGIWSITSSALSNGTYVITAKATNPIKNVSAASTSQTIVIGASVPTISAIATSDFSWGAVLDNIEDNTDGTVTVNTSNVEDGQVVTITLNGNNYTGTITSNVAQVTIGAAGLQGLTDDQVYYMVANVSDVAGNAAAQVTSANFTVNSNDSPTGDVIISGTVEEGQTLTASNTLADVDGLGTITYTWHVIDNNGYTTGNGGIGTTYTLVQADVGFRVRVIASYTDLQGTAESVPSSLTTQVTNVNDSPTGTVTIGGTEQQGQTLTAFNTLADADGISGAITYQWNRVTSSVSTAISGATSSTYTLAQADVGSTITVTASYTDDQGRAESVTSAATSTIANVNDSVTGNVTISGTAQQGETLTASNTLADADGISGAITYQWNRVISSVSTTISGATSSTYTLTQAEVGSTITVTASYTDDQGTAESVTSAATSTIANVNDSPTGTVTISGTAQQGETLTAANNLADADGISGAITYQWNRVISSVTTPISGATGSIYTLAQADVGYAINVTASYTDNFGTVESVTSVATNIIANVNDSVTGNVTISGTAQQGQTLTASNTLADADGISGAITYQWNRVNNSNISATISGATSSTYTLTQADVGYTITVTASYTDGQGTVESLTSAATNIIANVNELPTGTVTITGTAKQGQTLTVANNLADTDGISGAIAYQWNIVNSSNVTTTISGATSSTYTLTQAEVGSTITVTASYTDAQGTAESMTSAATSTIANLNDSPTGTLTIGGTAVKYNTLQAYNALDDPDGISGFINFQWNRVTSGVSTPISGATSSTYYTLAQEDVGSTITITASWNDNHGTAESVTSAPTALVTNVNDSPTGNVTISGTAEQGQILTASNTLADPDGISGAITYQWYRVISSVSTTISGATSSTYTLAQADVGSTITVTASYTDNQGTAESMTSAATSTIANVNDLPTGNITISGTVEQGQTLTAANTLADADGISGAITYQWNRVTSSVSTPISGATGSTFYTLTQTDVGSTITITASYTDSQGTVESVTSAPTVVVANVNDPVTGTVTIFGTAQEGQTLTVSNNLADVDGLGAISYQWKRVDPLDDSFNISGATSSSYTLTYSEAGYAIKVTVSYTDGQNTAESVTSSLTSVVTFAPLTDSTFLNACSSWISNNANALTTYGSISNWDVGNVTNMNEAFKDASSFNDDISAWDTSKVTTMQGMFRNTSAFNGNISAWDTSKVTDMGYMFNQASVFNQDIGTKEVITVNGTVTAWDTSKVTNMAYMFSGASSFNQYIGNWNTSDVLYMSFMFQNANTFNQNIGSKQVTVNGTTYTAWDTANVTNMQYMLMGSVFNNNGSNSIGNWNTSKVTRMDYMFQGTDTTTWIPNPFNQNINTKSVTINGVSYTAWDVGNVTNMANMFRRASFNIDISDWDTSKVENMAYMFADAYSFNQNINDWNVSNVVDFSSMFRQTANFNHSLSSWNTSNATTMFSMFRQTANFNQDIGVWDVSSVTNMSAMFKDTIAFNKEIRTWKNTISSSVTLTDIFDNASAFNTRFGGKPGWVGGNTDPTIDFWTLYFTPLTDSTFLNACSSWISNNATALTTYGSISYWDVGNVTSMYQAFRGASSFNDNISAWNTSNITSTWAMFQDATAFNQDISGWNVSNVTNMSEMFSGATAFNQDIGSWNTSNVTDMNSMFKSSQAFNQDIGSWNTSKVTNMKSMFVDTPFNQDIGTKQVTVNGSTYTAWDTINVTTMISIFFMAYAFNQDISSWNTTKVTSMSSMFQSASAFNQDIGGWNVSNVTSIGSMFQSATAFNGNISAWDTSKVENMGYMFYAASVFNQDISGWNVSSVTTMQQMFGGASAFNQPIGNWNVSKVTTMSSMFNAATVFNQDISGWNTSKVTTMSYMLWAAIAFNQDISGWNTSVVTNMNSMFCDASSFNSELTNWNTANVTDMSWMFNGATAFNQDIGAWNVSSVTTMQSMFDNADTFNKEIRTWKDTISSSVTLTDIFDNATAFNTRFGGKPGWVGGNTDPTIDFWTLYFTPQTDATFLNACSSWITDNATSLSVYGSISNWDVGNVTSMYEAFAGASSFNDNISAWNTINVTNMTSMFNGATAFNGNISGWDTGNVTAVAAMFNAATVFNQDISGWNTSNITSTWAMFQNATAFNQPIGDWDVLNVTTMHAMFYNATAFNQDIGGWNVSNVTNMSSMFQLASAFNGNISAWDTSKVTNMAYMFYFAYVFNQDISGWNVSNVTDTVAMFASANNFNQPIGSWNVSNITNMGAMFKATQKFNQPIGSWNVSSATNVTNMFYNAKDFRQEIRNWDVGSNTSVTNMFFGADDFNAHTKWNTDSSFANTPLSGFFGNRILGYYNTSYIPIYIDDNVQQSTAPYYTMYIDASGNTEFDKKLYLKNTYRFYRLNNLGNTTSHPFYITDVTDNNQLTNTAPSNKIIYIPGRADITYNNGLTGSGANDYLGIRFNFESDPADEFMTTDTLKFYCTSHTSMNSQFTIEGYYDNIRFEPKVYTTQEVFNADYISNNFDDISGFTASINPAASTLPGNNAVKFKDTVMASSSAMRTGSFYVPTSSTIQVTTPTVYTVTNANSRTMNVNLGVKEIPPVITSSITSDIVWNINDASPPTGWGSLGPYIEFDTTSITGGIPTSYSMIFGTLPTGISFSIVTDSNSQTRATLVGTPTVPTATATYTARFMNGSGSVDTTFTLTIQDTLPVLLGYKNQLAGYDTSLVYTGSTPNKNYRFIKYGVANTLDISYSETDGVPIEYELVDSQSLPSGMTFNTSTGQITGTPDTEKLEMIGGGARVGVKAKSLRADAQWSNVVYNTFIVENPSASITDVTSWPNRTGDYAFVKDYPIVDISAAIVKTSGLWNNNGDSPSSSWTISPSLPTGLSITSSTMPIPSSYQTEITNQVSVYTNEYAFAALTTDNRVIAWGDASYGGIAPSGLHNVQTIYSAKFAFAALKTDGSVVAWGLSNYGGSAPGGLTNVQTIYSTYVAFAALKTDGSVVAWGSYSQGGNAPSSGLTNVQTIYSTAYAFAALKTDGSVVAWGESSYGGTAPSGLTNVQTIYSTISTFAALKTDGSVVTWPGTAPSGLTSVQTIYSTYSAFAALKPDGSVVAWGDTTYGGDASSVQSQLTDVKVISSSLGAYAALKTDGTVVAWGSSTHGGDASSVQSQLTGVQTIYSNNYAFAALKTDGTVVAWGSSSYGGTAPSGLTNVQTIYSTNSAFAALKTDGSVVAWGDSSKGGSAPGGLTNVQTIYSNGAAFAALKTDGSLVTWGDSSKGGTAPGSGLTNIKNISQGKYYYQGRYMNNTIPIQSFTYLNYQSELTTPGQINHFTGQNSFAVLKTDGSVVVLPSTDPQPPIGTTNVHTIYSTKWSSFAALKTDGTVVAWGNATYGGDASSVQSQLTDVKVISSSWAAYAALKTDGSVVAWGSTGHGGDASSVQSQLTDVTTIYSTGRAFAALKTDGSVVAWGESSNGGTAPAGLTNVQTIYSTYWMFVALKTNGSVVAWGSSSGTNVPNGLTNVEIIYTNDGAFAAMKTDGSVVAWGSIYDGGNPSSSVQSQLTTGVKTIYSSENAFAALKTDGTVVAWGTTNSSSNGMDMSAPAGLTNVQAIYSTNYAFAALKTDGTVVVWGWKDHTGGDISAPAGLTNVQSIFSANRAFAALKTDGSVVAWGQSSQGGTAPAGLTNVQTIYSIMHAFAALKTDGSVVTWGQGGAHQLTDVKSVAYGKLWYQGKYMYNAHENETLSTHSINYQNEITNQTSIRTNAYAFAVLKTDGSVMAWGRSDYGGSAPSGLTNVMTIYSNNVAFAALKTNGTVVAWGRSTHGGSAPSGLTNVRTIYSAENAFAALKTDGTVVCWGVDGYGGTAPSSGLTNVETIYSADNAFAALRTDGTVVAWGYNGFGGGSGGVVSGLTNVQTIYSAQLAFAALKTDGSVHCWGAPQDGGTAPNGLSNVQTIYSTARAFAALKTDGSVVAWGQTGSSATSGDHGGDASSVQSQLTGVQTISSTNQSFAALKTDGTVVTWGASQTGGDSSSVQSQLTGVQTISSTFYAFAALKTDGTVVAWGLDTNGGNPSSSVQSQLTNVQTIFSNERAFAALKTDGTVVAWGRSGRGGDGVPSALTDINDINFSRVTNIYSNQYAFTALRENGTVRSWGYAETGGNTGGIYNGSTLQASIFNGLSNVKVISQGINYYQGGYHNNNTIPLSSITNFPSTISETEINGGVMLAGNTQNVVTLSGTPTVSSVSPITYTLTLYNIGGTIDKSINVTMHVTDENNLTITSPFLSFYPKWQPRSENPTQESTFSLMASANTSTDIASFNELQVYNHNAITSNPVAINAPSGDSNNKSNPVNLFTANDFADSNIDVEIFNNFGEGYTVGDYPKLPNHVSKEITISFEYYTPGVLQTSPALTTNIPYYLDEYGMALNSSGNTEHGIYIQRNDVSNGGHNVTIDAGSVDITSGDSVRVIFYLLDHKSPNGIRQAHLIAPSGSDVGSSTANYTVTPVSLPEHQKSVMVYVDPTNSTIYECSVYEWIISGFSQGAGTYYWNLTQKYNNDTGTGGTGAITSDITIRQLTINVKGNPIILDRSSTSASSVSSPVININPRFSNVRVSYQLDSADQSTYTVLGNPFKNAASRNITGHTPTDVSLQLYTIHGNSTNIESNPWTHSSSTDNQSYGIYSLGPMYLAQGAYPVVIAGSITGDISANVAAANQDAEKILWSSVHPYLGSYVIGTGTNTNYNDYYGSGGFDHTTNPTVTIDGVDITDAIFFFNRRSDAERWVKRNNGPPILMHSSGKWYTPRTSDIKEFISKRNGFHTSISGWGNNEYTVDNNESQITQSNNDNNDTILANTVFDGPDSTKVYSVFEDSNIFVGSRNLKVSYKTLPALNMSHLDWSKTINTIQESHHIRTTIVKQFVINPYGSSTSVKGAILYILTTPEKDSESQMSLTGLKFKLYILNGANGDIIRTNEYTYPSDSGRITSANHEVDDDHNVYIGATMTGGIRDAVVKKIDSSGNEVWVDDDDDSSYDNVTLMDNRYTDSNNLGVDMPSIRNTPYDKYVAKPMAYDHSSGHMYMIHTRKVSNNYTYPILRRWQYNGTNTNTYTKGTSYNMEPYDSGSADTVNVATDITIDGYGDVIVGGMTSGEFTEGKRIGSDGYYDPFIVKLSNTRGTNTNIYEKARLQTPRETGEDYDTTHVRVSVLPDTGGAPPSIYSAMIRSKFGSENVTTSLGSTTISCRLWIRDTYGDGWHGGYIKVFNSSGADIGGGQHTVLTSNAKNWTYINMPINVTTGEQIKVEYTATSYANEVKYFISTDGYNFSGGTAAVPPLGSEVFYRQDSLTSAQNNSVVTEYFTIASNTVTTTVDRYDSSLRFEKFTAPSTGPAPPYVCQQLQEGSSSNNYIWKWLLCGFQDAFNENLTFKVTPQRLDNGQEDSNKSYSVNMTTTGDMTTAGSASLYSKPLTNGNVLNRKKYWGFKGW